MWRRVSVDTAIDHPVELVFAYLLDPMSWHEFVPAVVQRRRVESGPVEIGSTWAAIDRIGPFKIHFTDELLAFEADRRVVWGSSSPWNAQTEYVLDPKGDATHVRARYEGDLGGWLRLLGWVPGPVVARILAQDFKRLGALLKAKAESGQR